MKIFTIELQPPYNLMEGMLCSKPTKLGKWNWSLIGGKDNQLTLVKRNPLNTKEYVLFGEPVIQKEPISTFCIDATSQTNTDQEVALLILVSSKDVVVSPKNSLLHDSGEIKFAVIDNPGSITLTIGSHCVTFCFNGQGFIKSIWR